MPRVHHVKCARKDHQGIKKGESYYWWAFRYGGKRVSKTYPIRSQLTQSYFLATIYDLEDGRNFKDPGEWQEEVESLMNDLEALKDETQDSLDAIPEQLQDGDVGQMLQERIEALEDWISNLESIELELEEDFSEEEREEAIESIKEELMSFDYEGP